MNHNVRSPELFIYFQEALEFLSSPRILQNRLKARQAYVSLLEGFKLCQQLGSSLQLDANNGQWHRYAVDRGCILLGAGYTHFSRLSGELVNLVRVACHLLVLATGAACASQLSYRWVEFPTAEPDDAAVSPPQFADCVDAVLKCYKPDEGEPCGELGLLPAL